MTQPPANTAAPSLATGPANPFRHRVISASAGSGKTFRLSHRVVALLAAGVQAERIVALTFSRKAAGEMFDSVLNVLANAAAAPGAARRTAAFIARPELDCAAFGALLRDLVTSLHRVRIGTLDSFNVAVLRAYPLEFGLAGEFDLLSEDQARQARRQVMEQIFARLNADDAARREFMEAFKRATFGQEEKRLAEVLDECLRTYHQRFQDLQDGQLWGNDRRIWPDGSVFQDAASGIDGVAAIAALRQAVYAAGSGFSEPQLDRWETFLRAAETFYPPRLPADMNYLAERLLPQLEELRTGDVEIVLERRKTMLTATVREPLVNLLTWLVGTIIEAYRVNTRSLFAILQQYEALYHRMVRRDGRLTFQDVTLLLGQGVRDERSPVLAQDGAFLGSHRLGIDSRLDCRLDHWLLDEFQDTSDAQYRVLANLIDEVVQDADGRRSFFYVGDVKQAIHGWRGGNAWLFQRILDTYNDPDAPPGEAVIQEERLATSYRSCPAVIDAVNATFGRLVYDERLPPTVRAHWRRLWDPHVSSRPILPGCAALLEVPDPKLEARLPVVIDLLRELDPIRRGLSVAILVRTNRHGPVVVDALRAALPGLPVAWEGAFTIADNPVVAAFMALFKAAAHPGDSLAWRHLEMSPLAPCIAALQDPEARYRRLPATVLTGHVLTHLHAGGFRGVVQEWGGRLQALTPLDAFGRRRLADLVEAASAFDATGERDIPAFLDFVREYRGTEVVSERAVRVMTMHRSKGLGFDVVILPDLQAGNILSAGALDLAESTPAPGEPPDWVMLMPPRAVAACDPALAACVEQADIAACNESLCLLYVAITRAKQGMYLIGGKPGKSEDMYRFLLDSLAGEGSEIRPDLRIGEQSVTCRYLAGDPDWYHANDADAATDDEGDKDEKGERAGGIHDKDDEKAAANDGRDAGPEIIPRDGRRRRPRRVLPSDKPDARRPAGPLFTRDHRSTQFGNAIHALFEGVEWLDRCNIPALITEWERVTPVTGDLHDAVLRQFRAVIAKPAVRQALGRPAGPAEVWREKRFEIVLDERWISGTFDRVTIHRDASGRATTAEILDFKSDRVDTAAEHEVRAAYHRPQLEIYRQVLARMVDLPPSAIATALLFTHSGRLVPLDAP